MERLRILAAAAALGQFTVSELAAFAGANENTVRSVLRRENEVFARVGSESRADGTGRPASIHRVVDPDRIRAEVRELEGLVVGVGSANEPQAASMEEDVDDRLAAVVVAEDAALRAWQSESPEDTVVLAETAKESVRQALGAGRQSDLDEPVEQRAQTAAVFAELAEAEARGESIAIDGLNRASAALAAYSEVAPADRAQEFSVCLADAALRTHQLPPVALLLGRDERPEDVNEDFAAGEWIRLVTKDAPLFADSHEALWGQSWAEPLFARRLLSGYIVLDRGISSDELEHSLLYVRERRMPTVVIGDEPTEDTLTRVAASGALFLPASAAGRKTLASTLWNAFGARQRYGLVE